MTTVFGVVDRDMERRNKLVDGVVAKLTAMDSLQRTFHRWEQGALVMLVHGTDCVPLSQASSESYWAGVCGNIFDDDSARTPAELIIAASSVSNDLAANGRSGLYLACTQDSAGTVVIGTDLLGFFPLYYWANPTLLVFSSSSNLIRLHPAYHGDISPEGLAGIMLLGYMAGDQSLWQGIRRPLVGYALRRRPGIGAETILTRPLTPSDTHYHLTYEQARRLTAETLRQAVRRSIRTHHGPLSVMLSGGLDSRLVAGYLAKEAPGRVTALTFGLAEDMEAQCARRVAKTLRMPEQRVRENYPAFASAALECIDRECFTNSLWDFSWLSTIADLPSQPILSGLHGDPVMGGSFIPYAWDRQRGMYRFDCIFNRFNAWGFSAAEIPRIVAFTDMEQPVRHVIEQLLTQYDALPGLPYQKASQWGFYHRLRFHVMPFAFRLSARGWPLMPYIYHELIDVALGMPMDYFSHRRLQTDTLKREFPELARLPLDRNSFDQTPLLPTTAWRMHHYFSATMRRLRRFDVERRTYYRQYDINNEGWRQIRTLAEAYRPLAHRLFRAEEFDRLIPKPEVRITGNDGIIDTAKHKLLINMMLFLGSGQ